jgi:hypothetical protein
VDEHLFVPGTPLNPYLRLEDALKARDVSEAWKWAGRIPRLDLERALQLVLLLAREESPMFQRAARRWLVRFIREQEPTVEQVMKAADALNETRTFIERDDAERALLNLGDQIRRRDVSGWKPKGL